jgi:hypothetical protein
MKIFVSCVSQKNGEIIADISKIKEDNIIDTFSEWKSQTQGTTPARDVYKGTQWELIKNLDKTQEVYVCSAGYGRLTLDTLIVPYSITFSSAYKENEHLLIPRFNQTQKQANQDWWSTLTLTDSVTNRYDKNETYVITVNPQYVEAFGDTFDDFRGKDNVIVLNEYRLGRLAKWLGSGANTLNTVFTQWLVNNYPSIKGNTELKSLIEDLDNKYGEDLYQKRNKCSDEFIKNHIKNGGSLKQLRDMDYSCSTQRFKNCM